jgi:hypothetical protein
MDNKGKWKSFTISDKISVLVQVDGHTGTHAELASRLRSSVSLLNTIMKNHEEIERSFIPCGPFSEQLKSLKCLPLKKLESSLHIKASLGIANFLASSGWVNRFKWKHSVVYRTPSDESGNVGPETIEDRKNDRLMHHLCSGYNVDETSLFFSLQWSKTFHFQGDYCHGVIKCKQLSVLCSPCAMQMVVIN